MSKHSRMESKQFAVCGGNKGNSPGNPFVTSAGSGIRPGAALNWKIATFLNWLKFSNFAS